MGADTSAVVWKIGGVHASPLQGNRALGVEKHAEKGSSGHRFLQWVVRHPSWHCGRGMHRVDLTGGYCASGKREVGIRVYVHNAIPWYPDYTPFTRRVLGSIGAETLVKAQQHTALPQQRCLSRQCPPVCRRTAGRAARRRGLQRPFALPIPSSEARRLPNILAVGGMIQQLRKEARACVACSSLACWPPRWGSRVHLHSLRE
jgi:hypothetical protein